MEQKMLDEYRKVMSREIDLDAEDVIQTRMLYLLENPEKQERYQQEGHFAKSLNWYVFKRQIRPKQQRENLVSMNDGEIEVSCNQEGENESLPILVSLPRDNHLYRHILNQFDSKGRRIWTTLQLRVIAKRYLGGKTQIEIATETGRSFQQINRLFKTIDSKILKLNLKDNISSWGYNGAGNNLPKSMIWKQGKEGEIDSKSKVYNPVPSNHRQPPIANESFRRPIPVGSWSFNPRSCAWISDTLYDAYKAFDRLNFKGAKGKVSYQDLIQEVLQAEHVKRTAINQHIRYNIDNTSSLMDTIED
jgi:hypothetical protein